MQVLVPVPGRISRILCKSHKEHDCKALHQIHEITLCAESKSTKKRVQALSHRPLPPRSLRSYFFFSSTTSNSASTGPRSPPSGVALPPDSPPGPPPCGPPPSGPPLCRAFWYSFSEAWCHSWFSASSADLISACSS